MADSDVDVARKDIQAARTELFSVAGNGNGHN